MVEITFELGNGQIQAIEMDATLKETHEASAEITEHPVELGENVSDHVKKNLDEVTLEVVISNEPIRQPGTQMDGVQAEQRGLEIKDPTTGIVLATANVLVFDGDFDRVRTVYSFLLTLLGEGIVVTIITSLREYPNMLLRRVSPIREALTGDALNCTVEAKQVRIVDSEVVDVPEPEEQRGDGEQNRGRRNNDETDEDGRNASIARGIVDTIVSWTAGGSSP